MKYYTTVIGTNGCPNKHCTIRNCTLRDAKALTYFLIDVLAKINLKGEDNKLGDPNIDGGITIKLILHALY
jgi:hypothetical protein